MKAVLLACALVLAAASLARAQDPAIVDARHYKVVLDNERTRVFRVVVPAGDAVERHGHPDAIMIPLSIPVATPPGGGEIAPPAAVFVPAQTHGGDAGSTAPVDVDFIYVELKGDASPAATLPGRPAGINSTHLVAHQKADALRVTIDTGYSESAGATHDFDQVLVALEDSEYSLTVDGRTRNTWKRGDVAFIGRHVKHESRNTGRPADFVVVIIK